MKVGSAVDTKPRPVSETTRERIVAVALQLCAQKGAAAVSMREIGRGAGITVQGLYYHFQSKTQLLSEIYEPGSVRAPLTSPVLTSTSLRERIAAEAHHRLKRVDADTDFLRHRTSELMLREPRAVVSSAYDYADSRLRWREAIVGATDLDPSVDIDDLIELIETFLAGVLFRYLAHQDDQASLRVDQLATLVANAHVKRRTTKR